MPDREMRIMPSLAPTHDSVRLYVQLDYLKGSPIETITLTPEYAAELGWKLVKAAEDARRNGERTNHA